MSSISSSIIATHTSCLDIVEFLLSAFIKLIYASLQGWSPCL